MPSYGGQLDTRVSSAPDKRTTGPGVKGGALDALSTAGPGVKGGAAPLPPGATQADLDAFLRSNPGDERRFAQAWTNSTGGPGPGPTALPAGPVAGPVPSGPVPAVAAAAAGSGGAGSPGGLTGMALSGLVNAQDRGQAGYQQVAGPGMRQGLGTRILPQGSSALAALQGMRAF